MRICGIGTLGPLDRHSTKAVLRPLSLHSPDDASGVQRLSLSVVGLAVQGGVRFVTIVSIGRLGGAAALSTVAGAISLAQLLSLLWPTTTGSAASKFVALGRGKVDPTEVVAVTSHLARRTGQASSLLATAAVPICVWPSG